jgi:signal transduction histidine kinase
VSSAPPPERGNRFAHESNLLARFLARIERVACAPGEDQEARARKAQFTAFAILVTPAGVLWGAMYYGFGESRTALIPLAYPVLTALNIALFLRPSRFEVFRQTQQAMILVMPFALQTALGGFVGSSAVLIWSFLAVISSVVFGKGREPIAWFCGFVLLVLTSAVIQPGLRVRNILPPVLIHSLFALNVATVSAIAFAVLYSFLSDRRKLRVLEVAYLRQEMMLRQQEKLATLGTLAAGVAHELNNPAAATRRAAEQLQEAFGAYESANRALRAAGLDDTAALAKLEHHLHAGSSTPPGPSSLERSDREVAIEEWLDEHGLQNLEGDTGTLVDAGLDVAALDALAADLPRPALGPALDWLARTWSVHTLATQIRRGSARISDIVASLKEYSFLDQAPIQAVNLAETIDATLRVMGATFGDGVTIRREFDPSVPIIEASGAELNQVWTNLLRNAADAMRGTGEITIRTRAELGQVVVEIEDDGNGIANEHLPRVFDPFFTTKPPGKGTGMGLATVFAIVRERHRGTISVESRPGRTVFTVRLPIQRQA